MKLKDCFLFRCAALSRTALLNLKLLHCWHQVKLGFTLRQYGMFYICMFISVFLNLIDPITLVEAVLSAIRSAMLVQLNRFLQHLMPHLPTDPG